MVFEAFQVYSLYLLVLGGFQALQGFKGPTSQALSPQIRQPPATRPPSLAPRLECLILKSTKPLETPRTRKGYKRIAGSLLRDI